MTKKNSNTLESLERLDCYIRAKYPVIAMVSHEETRVQAGIQLIASRKNRRVVTWTATRGFEGEGYEDVQPEISDIVEAIQAIISEIKSTSTDPNRRATIYIMKDIHPYLNDPLVVRFIRDVALTIELSKDTMILLSPEFKVPMELEKTIYVIDYPLPEEDELDKILRSVLHGIGEGIPVDVKNRGKLLQSLRGLTAFEAESVLLSSIAKIGEVTDELVPLIVAEKKQIIRKSGVLEFYDSDVTMSEVGGLENLKHYAEVKMKTYDDDARLAGVDPAKGCLIVGIPGTGKSLTAKAIAGGRMPLLRMDIGALMGGLVGQSEQNTRSALKVTEAVAPCVLWIDEIEKSLGGGGGELDGGTTQRVFGTILTWMQETSAPVYVIATANDVRALKPELLRRFDDIIFADLPNQKDRVEILKVHLRKRNRSTKEFDLESVGKKLWGFTGAEIEKVVKTALESAFFDGKPLTIQYLNKASESIVPLSTTMAVEINNLRNWSKNRTVQAGKPLETRPVLESVSRADSLNEAPVELSVQ